VIRFVALISLALAACGPAGTAGECIDNGDCDGTAACIERACVEVECLSSADCGLQTFCETEAKTFVCEAGCNTDDDCYAGEACDAEAHTCEAYGCRDTELDCSWGEICDTRSGRCEEAAGDFCDVCDYWGGSGCSGGAECVPFDDWASEAYCIESCTPASTDECPRGYECVDLYGDDSFWGCFAWCPDL
jgi:hypothetical protein